MVSLALQGLLRWHNHRMVRLLANKAVQPGLVKSISSGTIHQLLKKNANHGRMSIVHGERASSGGGFRPYTKFLPLRSLDSVAL